MSTRRLWAAGAAMILTGALLGCTPPLQPAPADARITLPSRWLQDTTAASHGQPAQAGWWKALGDPRLDAWVEAALAHNIDLKVAAARVDEARAALGVTASAGQPTVQASAGAQGGRSLTASGLSTSHSLQPDLQASWEPDLWGRLGQQTRAAQLQYRASQSDAQAVALTVASTAVQTYIGLLALQAQLETTRATLESREAAWRLARDQARVGYISQLQLTQSASELAAVQQTLPQLQAAIRRQENSLHVLAGDVPGPVDHVGRLQDLQLPPLPDSVPSDLLRRRPDIAQRSLLLAASDATLAARQAAFLPQVTLSAHLGELFIDALRYNPATVWGLGGSVLAPVFNGRRLSAQRDQASAQRDQAAYAYRGAVLNALADVESALTGVQRVTEQLQYNRTRQDTLARSLDFAQDRYQAGYASYLETLDAQRNLYQVQLDGISLQQTLLNQWVALLRALGGGWTEDRIDAPASGATIARGAQG